MVEELKNLRNETSSIEWTNDLRQRQLAMDFTNELRFYIVLRVLLDGNATEKKIKKERGVLELVSQPPMTSHEVLEGLEIFCSDRDSFKNFPFFLSGLYHSDILEEKQILKYFARDERPTIDYTKAKQSAEPFLKWLQQDEDSSSEESEDGIQYKPLACLKPTELEPEPLDDLLEEGDFEESDDEDETPPTEEVEVVAAEEVEGKGVIEKAVDNRVGETVSLVAANEKVENEKTILKEKKEREELENEQKKEQQKKEKEKEIEKEKEKEKETDK
eukprot:Trichotokara_eunicae@DN6249_c0_g1_i5.p1